MSASNDGGPAFPVPPGSANLTGDSRDGVGYEASQPGMSLRDYFAAMAMQGLCAYHGTNGRSHAGPEQSAPDTVAHRAYEIADAMLAERGKETS